MSAFDKVIGYDLIKKKLMCYCDILKNPEKYRKVGVDLPSGILLEGDPGLGKTLMSMCFIEESGKPAYIIRKSFSDGRFLEAMRNTFKEAANNTPSIILLDDMDKFANEDGDHRNAEEYIAVQSLMDEYSGEGIFFIATINSRYGLPLSLLRPGRFDCCIEVFPPEEEYSHRIIEHYLGFHKLDEDVDMELIGRLMEGESCATLETVVNEAGIRAVFDGKDAIDQKSLLNACLSFLYGDGSLSSEEESYASYNNLYSTAVHEVGHALVSEILQPGSVNLVSVLASNRRHCQGIMNKTGKGTEANTREGREITIKVKLGGKAASEIVMGEVDMGCEGDLSRAAHILSVMIDEYAQYGFYVDRNFDPSQWLNSSRDQIVSFELGRYYQETKRIISQNREFFDAMLCEVLEKKIITFRDIERIQTGLQGRKMGKHGKLYHKKGKNI